MTIKETLATLNAGTIDPTYTGGTWVLGKSGVALDAVLPIGATLVDPETGDRAVIASAPRGVGRIVATAAGETLLLLTDSASIKAALFDLADMIVE